MSMSPRVLGAPDGFPSTALRRHHDRRWPSGCSTTRSTSARFFTEQSHARRRTSNEKAAALVDQGEPPRLMLRLQVGARMRIKAFLRGTATVWMRQPWPVGEAQHHAVASR